MAVRLIKMVKLANSTADRLIYGEALVVRIREVAVVGNCGFTAPRYISGHTEHGQSFYPYCSSANLMSTVYQQLMQITGFT